MSFFNRENKHNILRGENLLGTRKKKEKVLRIIEIGPKICEIHLHDDIEMISDITNKK